MKKLPFFLLLILVLELTISVDSQNPSLLKFVLQWPPTFCIELNSHPQRPARCKEPIPQHNFTLHGLWPADQNGKSLECPNPPPPDPNWNQVFTQSRERQLVTFWPPLRENARNQDLWRHEWRAHGACGGTTPQIYFDTAIKINNMIRQGNLYNYLNTSGIFVSDSLSFTEGQIVEAIQKVFVEALDVYLRCSPIDPRNRTHAYLKDVALCTNLGGTSFISCPSRSAPKSCSRKRIMLPHPKRQNRDPARLVSFQQPLLSLLPTRRKRQQPPQMFQEEVDMTYPTFEKSWANIYIYTFFCVTLILLYLCFEGCCPLSHHHHHHDD